MTQTPDPDQHPDFYESVPFKRFIAWLIDVTLVVLICLLILPFTLFTGIFFFAFLILIVGFIYRVITLASGSATWGMRIMSIEIRDARDRKLDLGLAFLHTLGYSISFSIAPVQIISVVLMATSARCQGLTDMVLGTVAMNRRM